MVRQIQLVPAGSLGGAGPRPGDARPYDVLLRGMATEVGGRWSERGWLFLSLCRQLGLDGGLLTYTPLGVKDPIVWCAAILIDGKLYLFDTRIGLPVPDAKGDGVATLDEALSDPVVLDRIDLPGQSPYGTSRATLLASTSKIGVLIDSSPRYFSPRMKLLQRSLAGKNRTILYRDPAEQHDRFVEALGKRAGKVELWELPMMVETLLFTNPQFVEATQRSLFMFQSEVPTALRPDQAAAGRDPRGDPGLRGLPVRRERAGDWTGRRRCTPEVQQALDIYATYFLGMCHLEQKDPDQAERFFERTLQLLPEPGPGQPYYNMFRWGAQANLAPAQGGQGRARHRHGLLRTERPDHAAARQPAPRPRPGLARPDHALPQAPFRPPPVNTPGAQAAAVEGNRVVK